MSGWCPLGNLSHPPGQPGQLAKASLADTATDHSNNNKSIRRKYFQKQRKKSTWNNSIIFLSLLLIPTFSQTEGCAGRAHLALWLFAFISGLVALQNAFLPGRAIGVQVLPKICVGGEQGPRAPGFHYKASHLRGTRLGCRAISAVAVRIALQL